MPASHKTGIHWYRRDLRVADNRLLRAAADCCEEVCPVYLTSCWRVRHNWTGPNRQRFLSESLASLASNLEAMGGRLLFRKGPAVAALERLIRETGATILYFQRDPDPYGREAERAVETMCHKLGVAVHAVWDATLHEPESILTGGGNPYRVFTPYWRNWAAQPKALPLATVRVLRSPAGLASDPPPTLATWELPDSGARILPGGEAAARKRLQTAIRERLATYQQTRDLPAIDGTSRLSQDLRFGLLSARTIYHKVAAAMESAPAAARESLSGFIRELAWREFYIAILHHFPEVLDLEFAPQWRGLPWEEPDWKLDAWQNGRTGFPIVDAGMRELLATGHMHNRVRMITAMFLTKDLRYDWRLGESWFMRHLADGEIASNNGGWQWSAGTGADAAPYFRIQNPWSQTARYDPEGTYIKRWVPELAKVPPALLSKPPEPLLPLAPDYPPPIVDHHTERNRTLAMFKRHQQAGI